MSLLELIHVLLLVVGAAIKADPSAAIAAGAASSRQPITATASRERPASAIHGPNSIDRGRR